MNWHQKSIEQTREALGSPPGGLSPEEAQRRLEEYGPNELRERKPRTVFMMFLDQFKDFMIIVLILAAVVSGFIGGVSDTAAIIVIVVLNAVIGFVQEYRAERAMAALKQMAEPSATVMREGMAREVQVSEVVPGDVVHLEAGNIVPADVRLTEGVQLKVQEAALTGESAPVDKETRTLRDPSLPLGDRRNMLYKGTTVAYGRGAGVAVATGMQTELGRIASMLQEEEEVRTPLQKRLARFGQKLAVAVLVICAVVFAVGLLRGQPAFLMLLTAISLAVAAIPEALPAVVTISLALGAKKMVRQNALIRKLPAVETLGSVTYICSDKTGTLTLNRMSVEEVYADGRVWRIAELPAPGGGDRDAPWPLLLHGMALSNDARRTAGGAVIGDPTEVALHNAAGAKGLAKEEAEAAFGRVGEVPFDSERKLMSTVHAWDGGFVSFTKGAVDVLSGRCVDVLTAEGRVPLDPEKIHRVNDRMAADGLRVLGMAVRWWDERPGDMSSENVENGLTLIGLVGLMDPPREEAARAVDLCKSAGIRPVMITGDHPITARAIARRIGIMREGEEGVTTGRELSRLPLEEFEQRVEHIQAYARVAPEQKLGIVKALQERGQFVAMTGDGVNDAPALKRADIGVAMGVTGTDVAKESAHMVLLDDNFATIVRAVGEGRKIFDNIRKFIKYTMASNSGEIWTIFLAPFFGLPVPLLPIHILWINLVTDGLPGLALAMEPAEKDVMSRPPRHPQESIFAHGLGFFIVWVGLLMGFLCIGTQAWAIEAGTAHWQTMVFTVLCLSQMGNVLAVRSETESVFRQGLLSNMPLLGAFVLTLVLQMATIYVPFLNPVFKTEPLTAGELGITLGVSSVVFVAVEVEKLIKRRRRTAPGVGSASV
ncbi:MAG: cation-translocating P-type ATPase [Nitrospirota bacterium]|jgi:Ca2+-transporting ATPase